MGLCYLSIGSTRCYTIGVKEHRAYLFCNVVLLYDLVVVLLSSLLLLLFSQWIDFAPENDCTGQRYDVQGERRCVVDGLSVDREEPGRAAGEIRGSHCLSSASNRSMPKSRTNGHASTESDASNNPWSRGERKFRLTRLSPFTSPSLRIHASCAHIYLVLIDSRRLAVFASVPPATNTYLYVSKPDPAACSLSVVEVNLRYCTAEPTRQDPT